MEQIRYIKKGRGLKISVNDVCAFIGKELKLTEKQVFAIRWRFKRDSIADLSRQIRQDYVDNYPIIDKNYDFYYSNVWYWKLRQFAIIDRKINRNIENLFLVLNNGLSPFGIDDAERLNLLVEFIEVK